MNRSSMTFKGIQLCTSSYIPDLYKGSITSVSKALLTLTNQITSFLLTNLNGLVITAGYSTDLLGGVTECKIIYTPNMGINLEIIIKIIRGREKKKKRGEREKKSLIH